MNKHILLVMKWLKNRESVTQEELEASRKAAYAVYALANDYDAAFAADYAAYWVAAYWAAADAAYWADDSFDVDKVAYWVDIYFKRTGENKADYEKKLKISC